MRRLDREDAAVGGSIPCIPAAKEGFGGVEAIAHAVELGIVDLEIERLDERREDWLSLEPEHVGAKVIQVEGDGELAFFIVVLVGRALEVEREVHVGVLVRVMRGVVGDGEVREIGEVLFQLVDRKRLARLQIEVVTHAISVGPGSGPWRRVGEKNLVARFRSTDGSYARVSARPSPAGIAFRAVASSLLESVRMDGSTCCRGARGGGSAV